MLYLGQTGIQWQYDVHGSGPCLLFIHGWGADSSIWKQQVKHFSVCFKVITVDLPGHGQSEWKQTSLDEMTKDIHLLLEKEKCFSFCIVASSLGGLIAFKLFELFPQKVKSFVLVGSQPKFVWDSDYPTGLTVANVKRLGEQVQTSYPAIVSIFFRSLFTRKERGLRRYKWIQRFRKGMDLPQQEALLNFLDILEKEDLRDMLDQVSCPVQFITGTEDYICPINVYVYLKTQIPQSCMEWMEGCGHYPFLSYPREFNVVLGEFLNKEK